MLNTLLTHTPLLYLTQSLWRDEAFSILAAERPISFIFTKLGFEPPVYYTLLHFWVRIFGESEIATRSLSLLGFVFAIILVIKWSESLFKKHWLSWFAPLFFTLNPMLLYYAFEVRTYGWYTFFATAALYTYANKRWFWFIASSILGFYTHTYFGFHLLALGLHWLYVEIYPIRHSWKLIFSRLSTKSFLTIGISTLPWIVKIVREATRLKDSWYFPVDLHLVYSVLGNMFVGYEGTPWYGWTYTKYLSILLLACGILAAHHIRVKKQNLLFILSAIVPLITCIGISFIKPLFVNRYLISVTVAEVFVVISAIESFKNKTIQKCAAAVFLGIVLWVNWWYPPQHAKLPIRDTMISIHAIRKSTDIFLASSPIIYLEVKYYANDRSRVYLYNPSQGIFPWYVGDAVITSQDMVQELPLFPTRAFLVHEDGSYDIAYRMPITNTTHTTQKK